MIYRFVGLTPNSMPLALNIWNGTDSSPQQTGGSSGVSETQPSVTVHIDINALLRQPGREHCTKLSMNNKSRITW